jgi:hypothetical protein
MQNVSMVTSAGNAVPGGCVTEAKKTEHRIVLLWAGTDVKKLSESLNIYHLLIFAESPEEGVTKIRYYTRRRSSIVREYVYHVPSVVNVFETDTSVPKIFFISSPSMIPGVPVSASAPSSRTMTLSAVWAMKVTSCDAEYRPFPAHHIARKLPERSLIAADQDTGRDCL